MDKRFIKNLVGKKLSTLIEKYNFYICDFLDDDNNEMSSDDYNKLKNNKIKKIEFLIDDPNYDYIIYIDNCDFTMYGIFD